MKIRLTCLHSRPLEADKRVYVDMLAADGVVLARAAKIAALQPKNGDNGAMWLVCHCGFFSNFLVSESAQLHSETDRDCSVLTAVWTPIQQGILLDGCSHTDVSTEQSRPVSMYMPSGRGVLTTKGY